MIYYYRNTRVTFVQMLSALLATAVTQATVLTEADLLKLVQELIERELKCQAPLPGQRDLVQHLTVGQVRIEEA